MSIFEAALEIGDVDLEAQGERLNKPGGYLCGKSYERMVRRDGLHEMPDGETIL